MFVLERQARWTLRKMLNTVTYKRGVDTSAIILLDASSLSLKI